MYLNDTVTATVRLESIGAGRVLGFRTTCANAVGEVVLDGNARVLLPRRV